MRSGRFIAVLVLAAASSVACAHGPDPAQVHVSDGTDPRRLFPQHAAEIERSLRALLESCSTRGPDSAASPEAWSAAEAAPSIAAYYPKPTRVQTPDGEIEVDAILFAPHAGDYVLVRRDFEVRAFAKWKPELEGALVCDPALATKGHDRVRGLCDLSGERGLTD